WGSRSRSWADSSPRGESRLTPLLQRIEEAPDGWAEAVEIDEEGVVALGGFQRQEGGVGAAGAQAVGDLLLLLQREQDVGGDADGQRLFHADPGKGAEYVAALVAAWGAAVFGQVEPVHGAAHEQVAVRVEVAHEPARMACDDALHLEREAQAAPGVR